MFFLFSAISIQIVELATLLLIAFTVSHGYQMKINPLAFAFAALGYLGGASLFGKFRVFYHEFKHKLVSSLVGNKTKKLEVKSESEGYFEYEYSKETAKYNPLISLSPYFFPFVTLALIPFWSFNNWIDVELKEAILVFALSFDVASNIKEFQSHQSDLQKVPGGKKMAGLFLLSFNSFLMIIALVVSLFGYDWFNYVWVSAINLIQSYWEIYIKNF